MSVRLTKPQDDLLSEIRGSSTGGLWIRYSHHSSRTALALLRKGLVKVTDRDSAYGMAFYEPIHEPTEQEQ